MSIQKLLDDVTLWRESHKKANALFNRQLAPDFNLFSLFSINEMALSKCLAFLLDEKETHGQKDLFIKKFYNMFSSQKNIKLTPNQYYVDVEYMINTGRRLDILLTDNKKYIGIENKPWACDQKEQLKDYGIWLQQKAQTNDSWLLIYLCNRGFNEHTLPKTTDEAIKSNIIAITFSQLRNWLIDCALYIQAPKVKLFVEDLIQYIQEEVNGEIDMTQKQELIELILSNPNNLNSAFLIAQNAAILKTELFKKFIDNLQNQTTHLGVNIELDAEIEKCYSGFQIMFNKNDNFVLRWEFNTTMQRDMYYGICRKDSNVPYNAEKYQQIAEQMKDILSSPKTTENWPAWDWTNKNAMPNSIEDEIWFSFSEPQMSAFTQSVLGIINKVYENKTLLALMK